MQICIFPGRFQPFHNGHLMVVQGMMKACENATIIIRDSGKKTADDLFSVDERREMISAALLSANIMDANIVTVKDSDSDDSWVRFILDAAGNPADLMVWSGDEYVRKIFEAKGIPTKKIVPVPGIVGTEIRTLITKKDSAWRKKVPAGAMDVVEGVIEKMK